MSKTKPFGHVSPSPSTQKWNIDHVLLNWAMIYKKCAGVYYENTPFYTIKLEVVPWTDLVWVRWQSFWTPGWEWKDCRCHLFLSVWGAAAGAPGDSLAPQKPQNDCSAGSQEPHPICDSVRTRNKAAQSLSAHTTRQTPNEKKKIKQIHFKCKFFGEECL